MFFGEPFGGILPGARGAVLAVLMRTDEQLTGRQVYGVVGGEYSLWSVQEALKTLTQLGLVETRQVGRAGVHTINEGHAAVGPLRQLIDPFATLTAAINDTIDDRVKAVVLFGSIARGEGRRESDIDLAVIASSAWDGRVALHETVHVRLGNACNVLGFTEAEFRRLAESGEPVVNDIVRDGVALFGAKPRPRRRAA